MNRCKISLAVLAELMLHHRVNEVMDLVDLIKATIVCGVVAFLCYSFPVLGQAVIIAVLSVIWLGYAHRTLSRLLRR
jgi:hypothetical protein